MTSFPLTKKVVVEKSGTVKVVVTRQKPIFSRAGIADIASGAETVVVAFPTPLPDNDYVIMAQLYNSADNPVNNPFFLIKGYAKSAGGFTVYLSSITPTANYKLHWSVAEVYNP